MFLQVLESNVKKVFPLLLQNGSRESEFPPYTLGTPVKIMEPTMISLEALKKALIAITPRLPMSLQKLMPTLLPCLPLAFEIAKLLYKHREKIRDTIDPLTKQVSNEVRKGTDSIADIFSHLPKKIGRKLRRWSAYLPFALEIAKASYEKNSRNVRRLTDPFPSKIKRKIGRILKRHHQPLRSNLFRRSQRWNA